MKRIRLYLCDRYEIGKPSPERLIWLLVSNTWNWRGYNRNVSSHAQGLADRGTFSVVGCQGRADADAGCFAIRPAEDSRV